MKKINEMYNFIGHIVQVMLNSGNSIVGFVDDCETVFDNDIGETLLLDVATTHLPQMYRKSYPLETVLIKDIKDIEIVE
ncbi:hypothetical protein [Enterococcus xiangfangensis]|uniref:hypothetical protein n=1 Tax=Enterococcus xiangfangensis TaxID=1296537 RepID=UPI0010F6ADB7|nr:hypothetical protein [Enterococcus xiangfangensis]MBM7711342.1 hypothetical protein [Enterococcus xiangfangensis]